MTPHILPAPYTIDVHKPVFRFCGQFCILALLKFYGYGDEKEFRKLRKGIFPRFGFMNVKGLLRFLGNYGEYKVGKYNVEEIKKLIDSGHPVIQFISNGYTKKGHRNVVRGVLCQHYIVITGYDDKGFYIFDPAKPFKEDELTNYYHPFKRMRRSVAWGGRGIFDRLRYVHYVPHR